ncbi:MAG: hypothetical protein ABR881_02825 [Candidatus Sulfotelmatobacter sp.]|jgi:hypothetical protein
MRLGSLFCLLFLLVGITAAQDTNFPVGPQYLVTFGSPMFARPIATPTLWLDVPLPPIPSLPEVGPVIGNQPYIENPELQHEVDLFPIYYGYPMPSVVELTSAEPPRELPASIVDVGVAGITNAQSLREQGSGVPLGDTASFWKAHKPHAPRVYTNADVERLHGS